MKLAAPLRNKLLYADLHRFLKGCDPDVKTEVQFAGNRRFRADFLLPGLKIIVEVNGGQWVQGRHNRGGKGYENDLTKLNCAAKYGYLVFQFTYEMLERREYVMLLGEYAF